MFFWMLIPLQCDDALFPVENWHKLHAQQQRFTQQVDFLSAQPGPAICESILRCYYSGKPYLVDPFNSASLIHSGKLDENVLVSTIRAHDFAAIQFNKPPLADGLPNAPNERFTPRPCGQVAATGRGTISPYGPESDSAGFAGAGLRRLALL
jgi:hypothetical protein